MSIVSNSSHNHSHAPLSPVARTCVIATLGPSSNNTDTIAALIESGVNVFRLNFSHGGHDDHANACERVREVADQLLRPVAILQDLQGPKIRTGRFANDKIALKPGEAFTLTCSDDSLGDVTRVGVTYEGLAEDIHVGDDLLLDDGRLELQVQAIDGSNIHTKVIRGGTLSNNKGINLPGSDLSIPALSDKDVSDLAFGAELDIDWLAISFVRSRDDIQLARHYQKRFKSKAKLMAKIEKPSAVERFSAILNVCDGIMVARGDLGVELSPEQVPIVQKRLIAQCREAGKPVVTATQMLESMITSAVPTRAEASDVANAIFDGTDAVMLSAETATGDHPAETVSVMNRIALAVEADPFYQQEMREASVHTERTIADSVAHAACQMVQEIGAKVIVTFSSSGATALRVARHRVPAHVLAITPNARAYRQLALSWGVRPVLADDIHSSDEMVLEANRWILKTGIARPGDRFVITAGVPFGVSGTTNLIRAETVQSVND